MVSRRLGPGVLRWLVGGWWCPFYILLHNKMTQTMIYRRLGLGVLR
jgi:hypothetical protein